MNMNNYFKKKNDLTMFEDSSSFKDFFTMPFFKQDSMLKTDVVENNNSYTLIVDVPGYNKNDVKISNEDGYLTIEINKTNNEETTSSNYIKKERWHGSYSRSYYIGTNIESKDINATFSNGLLKISFPKTNKENTTKYIPIHEK